MSKSRVNVRIRHATSEYLTLYIRLPIYTVFSVAEAGDSIRGNAVICVKYSEWWYAYAKM